jgi:hypothetical protein
VFGYLGYRDMGVSQFPEIDFPVVSIVITREAASPDIMDGDVTDVVEDAVAGVEAGRRGGFGLVVGVARATGEAAADRRRALRDNGADLVVDDLAELLPPAERTAGA